MKEFIFSFLYDDTRQAWIRVSGGARIETPESLRALAANALEVADEIERAINQREEAKARERELVATFGF